jgi:N utilization substance protein A
VKSDFSLAFNQVCSDRGLSREVVLEALQAALVSAYRRNVDANPSQNVTATVDLETGKSQIFVERQVVEEVTDPDLEIPLADARALQPEAEVGDAVMVESTPGDFGRIAAQNAKQIILQRIREAERDARYAHYVQQEGEIVHGTVQSIKPQAVTLHLEGTEAILPRSQQVPGERYSLHQRLRAYVLEVRKTNRGPQIVVSRSHKNMLRRLLELEVPEIFNGTVEIKSIARESGSRSKAAVAARQLGVDPVGACVGMRGVRIQSIVNELGGEKIDVIEWNPDPATFIAKALSPAKVLSVQLEEDPVEGRTASVVVPDDQLSLAIGRSGQNARLAAKLTGWRIDIQGVTEAATWALQKVNEDPDVLPALGPVAELLPTVASSLRQHEQENLPYSSEELLAMRQVIAGVWSYYVSIRDAERARRMAEEAARRAAIEAAEAERRATIEAALALIPPQAHEIPLTELGLSARVLGHLERAGLATVGDVMERLAEGDEGLLKLEGIGPKSLAEVKGCIEALSLPEVEEAAPAEEEVAAEAEVEAEIAPPVEIVAIAEDVVVAAEEEKEAEPALGVTAEEAPPEEAVVEEVPAVAEASEALFVEEFEEEMDEAELAEERKRERRRRRELVYDEELGEVVAVRRRKRGDDLEEWEEILR